MEQVVPCPCVVCLVAVQKRKRAFLCDLYSITAIVDVGKRVLGRALVISIKSAPHLRLSHVGLVLRRSLKTLRPRTGRRAVHSLIAVRIHGAHSCVAYLSCFISLNKKPPAWGLCFSSHLVTSYLVAAQAVKSRC